MGSKRPFRGRHVLQSKCDSGPSKTSGGRSHASYQGPWEGTRWGEGLRERPLKSWAGPLRRLWSPPTKRDTLPIDHSFVRYDAQSTILKTSALQKTPLRQRKDRPHTGRTYLQIKYLIKNLCPVYINNSYNSVTILRKTQWKMGSTFEQKVHQRRGTHG